MKVKKKDKKPKKVIDQAAEIQKEKQKIIDKIFSQPSNYLR